MYQIQDLDPKCGCDHGVDSFWVSAEAKYPSLSFFIGVLLGMSPTNPSRIEWRCRTCNTVIAVSRDPELILAYKEA